MKKVFKLNGVWQYSANSDEIAKGVFEDSFEYDELMVAEISDWHISHVCILRSNGKFGIYNLHHFIRSIVDDLGTWCSPTAEPFPYDEVKYCLSLMIIQMNTVFMHFE